MKLSEKLQADRVAFQTAADEHKAIADALPNHFPEQKRQLRWMQEHYQQGVFGCDVALDRIIHGGLLDVDIPTL